ncbi:MAG: helix-turn-helix domain-containing protein [Oscillospiraceae bacterium]|nr:helix-turn-helix domain-containing protein [Oscillospiraceae bacterium]
MNTSKSNRTYTVDNVRIGDIIKQARTNINMTQEQLAEAVDVTPAFIGHIERGNRSLSLTTLAGVVNVLNIPMSYLFSSEDITQDQKTINDFSQLIDGRPPKTKKAVLDIVRTALKHLD